MTSSASISSETFIVPSSAVTAEPLRPMTMTRDEQRAEFAQQGHGDEVGHEAEAAHLLQLSARTAWRA